MGLTITRRLLILSFAAAPSASWAACDPPSVLFVCPAGTVKSAIAREVLRARADAIGLKVKVASRGLHPEDHVSPALAMRLRAEGIDPTREPARPLGPADLREADIVVAFDGAADAPGLREARAWRTPSWNADYAIARADLSARMDALIAELRRRAGRCR